MKLQLFAIFLIIAGAIALPEAGDNVIVVDLNDELAQRNPVENSIRRVVERISANIQGAGLDPLEVENKDFELIPITIDLVVRGFIENLKFYGLSDISINVLEYSYIFNRLRIDVSLPEIALELGDSGIDVLLFGNRIEGGLKGSLYIKSIRLAGEVYVNVNIIGAISLRSLSVNFSVGGIESDLNVALQGSDRSEFVNNLLNKRIPDFLEDNKKEINEALEFIISVILNRVWN